ncbi:uncharacterized protein BP01DRAFT_16937 [Aspergillus saccharolyticus JOP 1030-1]|uniref:Uncharacterized protein n=1 Tax=Aspergillus saccharolyticus JOP 1030-1 TaxID=1450539 RepID=A0A318ZG52_9EURO|nr:hypothetical protein BP01DRAFT_16937 [Aspergillus saccharolyticus JOP 1030-1]PYH46536.1 hypothetical protein BP01DRAFT_16937 [Aspergillus saccharolyticus JOP 1030-1]
MSFTTGKPGMVVVLQMLPTPCCFVFGCLHWIQASLSRCLRNCHLSVLGLASPVPERPASRLSVLLTRTPYLPLNHLIHYLSRRYRHKPRLEIEFTLSMDMAKVEGRCIIYNYLQLILQCHRPLRF